MPLCVKRTKKHPNEHKNIRDNEMATDASKHEVSQFDTTAQSGTNTIRTALCATATETPMSDHDSDSAKMDSDDESTKLHIHDCDVRDDAEEVSTIYAGEIHTRLAEETILTSARVFLHRITWPTNISNQTGT